MKNTASFRRRSRRSRGIRRRIALLAALLALAALAAWLWPRPHSGTIVTPTAPAAGVSPLLRATAPPAPIAWSASQRSALAAALNDAFAPALQGAQRSSLVVLANDGTQVYARDAERAATPASALKLVVAAAALHAFGPDFRFQTVLAAGEPVGSDGTLPGNLWLVGSGDPSLRFPDLRAGVSALAQGGLRRIGGGVAVDASAERGPEINPHWEADDVTEDYAAPTSGISLDEDTAEFDVRGASPGLPAQVRIVPDNDVVQTTGSIATSAGADDVTIAAQETPNLFRLSGTIPAGASERYWLPLHGIAAYAGDVLARMLAERGIVTSAPPSVGSAPLNSIALWRHRSAPLRALETHMLVHSDNHYAEQLLRALGGEAAAGPTDRDGLLAERRFLSERGIPTPGMALFDGSGLAPDNRIAAITLARILSDAELRGGDASLYLMLPQGGRQGTLRDYDFTTALGRVRAKSGHIGGVAALAGYVNTLHHGRVVFAFIVNGSPGDPDAAIVRAVNRLAVF